MGATRAVHVADDALAGACIRSTVDVLAAALRTLTFDLVFVGADTSDGSGGVVGAALAARLGLPYLSYASDIAPAGEGRVRAHRISATGYDVLEAPTPAVVMGTQLLGEPRYPSLRGIMGARSKEIATRSLADLGLDSARVGGRRGRDDPGAGRGATAGARRCDGGRGPPRTTRSPRWWSSSRPGGSSDGRHPRHRRDRSERTHAADPGARHARARAGRGVRPDRRVLLRRAGRGRGGRRGRRPRRHRAGRGRRRSTARSRRRSPPRRRPSSRTGPPTGCWWGRARTARTSRAARWWASRTCRCWSTARA